MCWVFQLSSSAIFIPAVSLPVGQSRRPLRFKLGSALCREEAGKSFRFKEDVLDAALAHGQLDRRHQSRLIPFPERRQGQRRHSQRLPVNLPITFNFKGKYVKAICRDLGAGGARLHSNKPTAVGTRLVLQLSFSRNLCFVGFTGDVVYAVATPEPGGKQTYELGLCFQRVGQVEEQVLEACLVELGKGQSEAASESVSSSLIDKQVSIVVTDRALASQFIRRRVVITGMGVISPIGIGREQFSQGLQQGRSGVSRITRFDASDLPSQLAAEVKDFDPAQFLSPKKIRQMDRCTQFAVAAALQAVADAEIVLEKLDRERVGVLIGTAVGGLRWAFEQQRAQQAGGYKTMDPYSIIATYPNAVSGQVAVELGLKGRSDTISSGCASAGTAFGIAAEMIQRRELDLVVVGGTESPLDPTIFGAMCSAGALSTLNDEPVRTPRPFDAERDGPVLGEGAGVLIFEELEHALQRGAFIYAEFRGWGSTSDAFSLTRTDPRGHQAVRAVQIALRDAGLVPEDIDYINAYGLATPACDWAEARVIKAAFGARAAQIPVSAIQSMTGYPWAAIGAFQLIGNCLAITEGVIAPTINFAVRDSNFDLDVVPNQARHGRINTALSNVFGCGKNVVLIVQRAIP